MNKKIFPSLIFFFLTSFTFSLFAQQAFTIEDAILRAKAQSPFSKQAETRKENRYWGYRSYKTTFNPQLVLQGTLPSYAKSVNPILQDDGTYKYIPVEQTFNNVRLGLVQPIFMTGATVSANTSLNYFEDYSSETPFKQWSGSVMNVELEQPLFAFNPLRWERKIQPLIFEESKRDYVEDMEFISEQ